MKIKRIGGGGFPGCSYMISDDKNTESVIVDPTMDLSVLQAIGVDISNATAVIATHGHIDHIYRLDQYVNLGLKLMMHKADYEMLSDGQKNASYLFFKTPMIFDVRNPGFLEDNDIIKIGDEQLTVMHTPGHTEGGITLIGDGFAVVGDTMFAEGDIGRYDLYSSDKQKLIDSIVKILSLDPDTVLYCGHLEKTTVGTERMYHKNLINR